MEELESIAYINALKPANLKCLEKKKNGCENTSCKRLHQSLCKHFMLRKICKFGEKSRSRYIQKLKPHNDEISSKAKHNTPLTILNECLETNTQLKEKWFFQVTIHIKFIVGKKIKSKNIFRSTTETNDGLHGDVPELKIEQYRNKQNKAKILLRKDYLCLERRKRSIEISIVVKNN